MTGSNRSNPFAAALPIKDTTNFQIMTTETKKLWKCDVCQEACFDDFDEACRHEEQCAKMKQRKEQAVQDRLQSHLQSQKQPNRTVETSSKSKKRERPKAAPHPFFAPRAAAKRSKQGDDKPNKISQSDTRNDGADTPSSRVPSGQALKKIEAVDTSSSKDLKKRENVVVDLTHDKSTSLTKASKKKTNTSVTKNTQRRTQAHKRKAPPATISNPAETAAALAEMIDTELEVATSKPKKMASIFDRNRKNLMAEQQQVEFQAQRRLKQQQERERQQKRAAIRQSKQSCANKDDAIALSGPRTVDSTYCSSTQRSSATIPKTKIKKALPPLAPRFPTPSHIMPVYEKRVVESNLSNRLFDLSTIEASRKSRTKVVEPQAHNSTLEFSTPLRFVTPPPMDRKLGMRDPEYSESRDRLFDAFLSVFTHSKEPVSDSDSRLWLDKFGIHSQEGGSADVLGKENRIAARRIRSWVDEWRKARHRAMDRMAERQRKLQGKRKPRKQAKKKSDHYDDDDYLWNDSDDEESNLCNLCLLTGPTASFKSSLVHMVASQSQCTVLEINTTENRGGTALKKAIKEATQSCSSLQLLKQHHKQHTAEQASIFQKLKRPLEDSDDDGNDDETETAGNDAKSLSSLTLILIDEADVVFEDEGDTGFWTAIAAVAKTAKCPIFLTANEVPPILDQMSSIEYEHIETARPNAPDCASKLLQILRQNKDCIKARPELNGESIRIGLMEIAEICNCDLRRMIHELQLFSTASSMLMGFSSSNQARALEAEREIQQTATTSVVQMQPRIESIRPASIPATKYSVITITGVNFSNFAMGSRGCSDGNMRNMDESSVLEILVGGQMCPKVRLVDENTLLALCPPCLISESVDPETCRYHDSHRKSLTTRFAPVEVRSMKRLGCVDVAGRAVCSKEFSTGTCVSSSMEVTVTYDFDDCDNELEFGGSSSGTLNCTGETRDKLLEDGIAIFNAAEPKSGPNNSADEVESSKRDRKISEELERLADKSRVASDAWLLEDLQDGIPILAGACRGFGFDLTQQVDEAGCRQHENARPPSEERLFKQGWNETSYFFGDNETFMVKPTSVRERRLLNATMTSIRGVTFYPMCGLGQADNETAIESGAMEAYATPDPGTQSDEDAFLPQSVPASIRTLPCLLRQSCGNISNKTADFEKIEKLKSMKATEFGRLLSFILPKDVQSRVACRGFGQTSRRALLLDDTIDSRLVLDYLPTLRRIAIVECAAEETFYQNKAKQDETSTTGRRTTRRSARNQNHRRHYFDSKSKLLQLDMGDLNSSQVGTSLAEGLLVYNR